MFSFTVWIFYGMSMLALIVLRYKCPNMNRPYKVRFLSYKILEIIYYRSCCNITSSMIVYINDEINPQIHRLHEKMKILPIS